MKVPALLAVVAAHAAVADARHTPRHLKKIVNGEEVPVGAYPFMVQLVDVGCGGSVIDAHWVLTAAHCEFQETIVVGAHSWYGMEGQYLQVTANFKHPEYNPDTYDQDFQLLYIEEGIDLEQFPPVVLNTDDSMYPAATSLTIAGWGAVESGGDTPGVLLEATVNVVDQGECHTSYAGAITDNMMCAAAYGTDTCQGDSGGPIFDVKEDGTVVQVGVVSWGNGCADPLYPGVYARVSSQIVWIRETMAEGVQCLDVCCGAEVDCQSCALEFLHNGGCEADPNDVESYIPPGCYPCGEEAAEICDAYYGSYGGSYDDALPDCGCESLNLHFCNHDFGPGSGDCEDCINFATPMDCYTDGLPPYGEASCELYCFPETRKQSGAKESKSGRHLLFGNMDECPSECMASLLCPDDLVEPEFQCDDGCTIPDSYTSDGYCDCASCEDEPISCDECRDGCPTSCGTYTECE